MTTAAFWPSSIEIMTIVAMAVVTYFTRIVGFLWLRKHQLSARARAVLESSPCCVMVAVVAPTFMTTDPKTLLALFFCTVIAFKFNLGITICASVAFMAILQNFF